MVDPRDEVLAEAYAVNAGHCETLGHHYRRDPALNGDWSCGYCRAVRALYPLRDIDQMLETVP